MEYLCDIFDKLTALNLSLQGNNMYILNLLLKNQHGVRNESSSLKPYPHFEKMCGDHQAHPSH